MVGLLTELRFYLNRNQRHIIVLRHTIRPDFAPIYQMLKDLLWRSIPYLAEEGLNSIISHSLSCCIRPFGKAITHHQYCVAR